MPPSFGSGLNDFFDVVAEVRKVALVAAGGLIVLPLLAGLGGFQPPWPKSIPIITSLLELVVLIVVYQLLSHAPRALASRVIVWSALSVALLSTVYLVLSAIFVYQIPDNDTRVVLGCGLGENTKVILAYLEQHPTDVCPGEFTSMLEGKQYNTDQIWTKLSVNLISAVLVLTWLGSFGALAALVSVFVSFQRRQRRQRTHAGN